VCFHFPDFKYDPTGGSNATKVEPACATLRAGSSGSAEAGGLDNVACSNPTTGTEADCFAVEHACYKLANSMFTSSNTKKLEVPNGKALSQRYHAWLGDTAKLRRVGGIH